MTLLRLKSLNINLKNWPRKFISKSFRYYKKCQNLKIFRHDYINERLYSIRIRWTACRTGDLACPRIRNWSWTGLSAPHHCPKRSELRLPDLRRKRDRSCVENQMWCWPVVPWEWNIDWTCSFMGRLSYKLGRMVRMGIMQFIMWRRKNYENEKVFLWWRMCNNW